MARNIKQFAREMALPDVAATEALGARIAAGIGPGDAIALEGDLGAGKTTLARAILRAMGVPGAVPSPTFTLVQNYETAKGAISHYDLYRIEDARELDELGLDDALASGAILIEWPELAASHLPETALHIRLSALGTSRKAHICGPQSWAKIFSESTADAG